MDGPEGLSLQWYDWATALQKEKLQFLPGAISLVQPH